jgi:hypothetical protein
MCCIHHKSDKLTPEEMNPRNYKYKPPCALTRIQPAGKPIKISESVGSLFK